MSEVDHADKIKKLNSEISILIKSINKLNEDLQGLNDELEEKQQEKKQEEKRGRKEVDAATLSQAQILKRASEHLTMGTKTFNRECTQGDYKKGAIRDNYICSKASEGYRYRPIGNPGGIYWSHRDIARGEGYKSHLNAEGGSLFSADKWGALREKQIKRYENDDLLEGFRKKHMAAGGLVESVVARMSRPRTMAAAEAEGEKLSKELGEDKAKIAASPITGKSKKNKRSIKKKRSKKKNTKRR